MSNLIETIYIYIVGVTDWLTRWTLRLFPYAAVLFGVLFVYGLIGGHERGNFTTQDIPMIVIISMGFTIAVLLYVVAILKKERMCN